MNTVISCNKMSSFPPCWTDNRNYLLEPPIEKTERFWPSHAHCSLEGPLLWSLPTTARKPANKPSVLLPAEHNRHFELIAYKKKWSAISIPLY